MTSEIKSNPSSKEKPFEGTVIYYSGSIRGVKNMDPDFAHKLVSFMMENGADVISEHVAARNEAEMNEIFLRRTGIDRGSVENPWEVVRKVDLDMVDHATHLVAIINGPSHGVGIEIEHAILKPSLGLNETPILCLVQEDLKDMVTWMIKGISRSEAPGFCLKTYKNLQDAKDKITEFLSS